MKTKQMQRTKAAGWRGCMGSGRMLAVALVGVVCLAGVARQAQAWSWPSARNSDGSATPGAPAALYLGDTGVFTCDSWSTVDGKWGRAQVVIHTSADINNGSYGGWSDYTGSDPKSGTSPRFTQTGTWYWGIQVNYTDAGNMMAWYCRNSIAWIDMWGTPTSDLTVDVQALNAPTGVSATRASVTSITLGWTRGVSGTEKDTLVVRTTSAAAPVPTGGTSYSAGNTLGAGTVVYKGNGTSFTDTGLAPGTTYYYHFYAENYSYYSVAASASATTTVTAGQTISWRGDGGQTSGAWEQANAWWYNTDGFAWGNCTDWGPHDVSFDNNVQPSMTIGVASAVRSLTFAAGATAARTISGSALTVGAGVTNNSTAEHTFRMPVVLGGANTWSVASGGTLVAEGIISGSAALTKTGAGTLVFGTQNNSYSGVTTVSAGTLQIGAGNALGSTSSGTTVETGGTLALSGGITVLGSESISLSGTLSNADGNNTVAGTVTSEGGGGKIETVAGNLTLDMVGGSAANPATVTVAAGTTVTVNDTTSGGALKKYGDGVLRMVSAGTTAKGVGLWAGVLELNGAGTLNALNVTNMAAGTTLRMDGAAEVRRMYFTAAGATVEMDATSATECETLSTTTGTTPSGVFSVGAAVTVKLTPSYTFNPLLPAQWMLFEIKRSGGSFSATEAERVTLDTTGFGAVAGTFSAPTRAAGTGGANSAIVVTFTPSVTVPVITAGAVTEGVTTAGISAAVDAGGVEATVEFEYGLTAAYGNTAPVTGSPVGGDETAGAVSVSLSGLTAATTYYYRWTAANVVGSAVAVEGSFTTGGTVPVVADPTAMGIDTTSAVLGATVTDNGGVALTGGGVQYGLTAAYGNTVQLGAPPAVGTPFTVPVSGLTAGTVYHYRGYGVNTVGAGYGYSADATFCTLAAEPGAPTALDVSQSTAPRLNLTWTAGADATGYVVVRSAIGTPTGVPVDGAVYAVGDALPGARSDEKVVNVVEGATVCYNNASTPPGNGTAEDTPYYYAVYAYAMVTGEETTHNYNATPAVGDQITRTTPPADIWTVTPVVTPGARRAEVTWTPHADAVGGYMLVIRGGADAPVDPTAGTIYAPGDLTGVGSTSTVVYVGTLTTAEVSGLIPEKQYTVEVWAFNGNHYRSYRSGGMATFTTGASTAPTTQATGVDDSSFLFSWSEVAGAAAAGGYDVQFSTTAAFSSSANLPLVDSFSTAEGWVIAGTTFQGARTVPSGTWTLNYCQIQNGYIYLDYTHGTDGWIELPPLTGVLTNLVCQYYPNSVGSSRALLLEAYENGVWTLKATFSHSLVSVSTETFTYTPPAPIVADGLRMRVRNSNSASINLTSMAVNGVPSTMVVEGHSCLFGGLTAGQTYYARVQVHGANDWSDGLAVPAGLLPSVVAASDVTSSGFTLGWNTAVEGATGYRVDLTTRALENSTNACPTGTAAPLGLNTFNAGQLWCYTGTTATASSGSVQSAPAYSTSGGGGHFLTGRAGNAIESAAFPLAGASQVTLSYSVLAWNLASASVGLEAGRVNAYYKLDNGPWCLIASDTPPTTTDSSLKAVNVVLPHGALEGTNIAFKLVAVKAETLSNYLRGPYIQALKVTMGGEGGQYDAENRVAGWPKTVTDAAAISTAVTGLAPNTPYWFRVQAVKGADVIGDWVAGETTTLPIPMPDVWESDVGRYQFTVNWSGVDDASLTGYRVQVSSCAGTVEGNPATNACPNAELATTAGDAVWSYVNRTVGYPSWQTWGGYNGGMHQLRKGTPDQTASPGIESPLVDLAGMSSARVDFMHAPNYQNPVAYSYVSLYYSLNGGSSWVKASTLLDAGQVYPSLVYKALSIALPSAALKDGVKLRLMADNAQAVISGTVTNYYGARLSEVRLVTVPVADTADWESPGCVTTHDVGAAARSQVFTGLTCGTRYAYRVMALAGAETGLPGESEATTLDGAAPPASIWANSLKQRSMRLEWTVPSDATANTRYRVQVSSCAAGHWNRAALAASSTSARLVAGDDWGYHGGGEDTTAESAYIANQLTYPAWAGGLEQSQVLAGNGEPALESVSFSTMDATNAVLSFGHGRWYGDSSHTVQSILTLSYSIDDGASWTDWHTTASAYANEYATNSVTAELPVTALGQEHVRVRITAKGAETVGGHARGAAVRSATVTLNGASGDFDGASCVVAEATDLTEPVFPVTGLTSDTPYFFRVAATDGATAPAQYGVWMAGTARTLPNPVVPAAPWAEQTGTRSFLMKWNAVEGAEVYNVEVRQGATTVFTRSGVEGRETQVTGLLPGTAYTFTVAAVADGGTTAASPAGSVTTLDGVDVTGLCATDIGLTQMDVVWAAEAGLTYTLAYGPAGADASGAEVTERLVCPNETLKRSDAGREWFYFGGNASWPAYYSGPTEPDTGHALIYTSAGAPGIQSRWFSTIGVTNATVDFLHGRFNSTANSAVEVSYSTDDGKTWVYAGTAPASSFAVPTDVRSIALPAAALNRRSVAVRLTASAANNNYGAHVDNLAVTLRSARRGTTASGVNVSGGSHTLSGLTAGTRYWFALTVSDGTETATATASAATRTAPETMLRSQGFDGFDGDQAWPYTIKWITLGGAAGDPNATEVRVAEDENPLYGGNALRMSGSTAATTFGVAEFSNVPLGSLAGVLTIPFAAMDLKANDYLYFSYSTDQGITWNAPVTNQTSGGMSMMRIGAGGSDVMNQNWAWNRGTNTTTRPAGNPFVWHVPAEIENLMIRLAFCGQSGGATHYYYIDEVSLIADAGIPLTADASANEGGGVDLTWTPPPGQRMLIIRAQDKRMPPESPFDPAYLPEGYSVVLNGTNMFWPEDSTGTVDTAVWGGYRYYYYFYAVLDEQIGTTPVVKYANVNGMVQAIASQGWDDWDLNPWSYRLGRVTNPGRSSDFGWWKANGMNNVNVEFIPGEWETWLENGVTRGQIRVTDINKYYGGNSMQMSGCEGFVWSGSHTYVDYAGETVTVTDPHVNPTNVAVEFANVDLSGYRNVKFQMHFAGTNLNGGNDLHVAISTNGGAPGSWLEVANTTASRWQVNDAHYDYGKAISDGDTRLDGNWDFYFEDSTRATPYGNPYELNVPDTVTQMAVRVMFFDSNGGSRRNASYFIDEVRLLGERVLETPRVEMINIANNAFTAEWSPVAGASDYSVRLTPCEADPREILVQESFVVTNFSNGWTTEGTVKLVGGKANRTGTGYAASLGANGAVLTSPDVGAARAVSFYVEESSSSPSWTLHVQAQAVGSETWESVTNLTEAGGVWTNYAAVPVTAELPSRQHQRVRFLLERSGNSPAIHLDDIQILGGGDFSCPTAGAQIHTGSATSHTFTGLSSMEEYFVEVQAHGVVDQMDVYSDWGVAGDYTAGDFSAEADGFEMVRLAWDASGDAPVLVATAPDGVIGAPDPSVTYTPGDTLPGGGTVLAVSTASMTNVEHVVPFNAGVSYAAFWKKGNHYEGRANTNLWMRRYSSTVADAMAFTNGLRTDVLSGPGKGWSGGWTVSSRPAWGSTADSNAGEIRSFGLVAPNQLYGAGGNQLALYPGGYNAASTASVRRSLATPLSASSKWWGLFVMKITYAGNDKWAGVQLLDANGVNKASIGKLWNGSNIGIEGNASATASYTYSDGATHLLVFHWDGAKMWLGAYAVTDTNTPMLTADTPAPGVAGGTPWQCNVALNMSDIASIQLVAQNSASAYLSDVFFDEVRLGPTWESLVGGGMEPPMPVDVCTAVADGNELVRLAWEKPAAVAAENSPTGKAVPAAAGVLVAEKTSAFNQETDVPQEGRIYAAGELLGGARVVYSGDGTALDHVVAPGSTHYYRFFAHSAAYVYTNGVDASSSAPSACPVVMGTYGPKEFVNPFSYTNGTAMSDVWRGGNGFLYDNSGTPTFHYWSVVNGSFTAESPANQVPNFRELSGYPAPRGNLLKGTESVLAGQGTRIQARRNIGIPITSANATNFYVAFMMAYQYEGPNKWAGLSLCDSAGVEKAFFGKGSGANYFTLAVEGTGQGTAGTTSLKSWAGDLRAYGTDTNNVYLILGRYNFPNRVLSVKAIAVNALGAQFPTTEPDWDASVTLDAGRGITEIAQLFVNAGALNGAGNVGNLWMDEIRFSTDWENLVAVVCPESILSVTGTGPTPLLLGDRAVMTLRSAPVGLGQSAAIDIHWDGGDAVTYPMSWLRNEGDTYTEWTNSVQMIRAGTVGGTALGAIGATGRVYAVNSGDRCEVAMTLDPITVHPLVPPTIGTIASHPVQTNSAIVLNWTKWNNRDVMVVRFGSETARDAAQPVQGRAYYPGDALSGGVVVYRGAAECITNNGLAPDTTHYYAFFSENWSYYSPLASGSGRTEPGAHDITIDGDPQDWFGEPPVSVNSARWSLQEYIWKDKRGEERNAVVNSVSTPRPETDIREFRIYADADWVYFFARMTNITDTTLPFVAVGADTRRITNSTAMNWLGDEANTFIGGDYFEAAATHYPALQFNVHSVDGAMQVERFSWDGTAWTAPTGTVDQTGWAAATKAGEGMGVEWRIHRSDIGLADIASDAVVTTRFTVATFLNNRVWNNNGAGTVLVDPGTANAVDALSIPPYLKADNDARLSAWDEDLSDGDVDFWVDVRFDAGGVVENLRPAAPEPVAPADDAETSGGPVLSWTMPEGDTDGDVTSFLLEIATNETFGCDVASGTTENGPVALRVNLSADTLQYKFRTTASQYWWRVRARDTSGELSSAAPRSFRVVGKLDNDGPHAELVYVGNDVAGYLAGDYARDEQLYPEILRSVTDHEIAQCIENQSNLGFVLRWTDESGVYATNKMHGNSDPSHAGAYAWNVISDAGRVSPNWDLIAVNTVRAPDDPPTAVSVIKNGITNLVNWTYKTNTSPNTDFEVTGWTIEWGYDDAFPTANTIGSNGNIAISNAVPDAFRMTAYDPDIHYYLTVSAEDCCTEGAYGEEGYWDDASWSSYAAGATDTTSGECADAPNNARNITTNQLIRIDVRDNDETEPAASTKRWDGRSMMVTTNATKPSDWSNPADALPRTQGTGERSVFTVTDGALIGRPLSFHFNVYDPYLSTLRFGTTPSERVGAFTVTNTAFIGSVWGTNWVNYSAALSELSDAGRGDTSIATWSWPAMDVATVTALWGADAVAAASATNQIALDLYDADNDRAADQASDVITFGSLVLSDDDTDDPVVNSLAVTGTGIGSELKVLATWALPNKDDPSGTPVEGLTCGPVTCSDQTKPLIGNDGVSFSAVKWDTQIRQGFRFSLSANEGRSFQLAQISFDAYLSGSVPQAGPQVWELLSSSATVDAMPLCSGTFDLGEDGAATINIPAAAWSGYGAAMNNWTPRADHDFQLMAWRNYPPPDGTTARPGFYIKNIVLIGSMPEATDATKLTDGDLANGTAHVAFSAHDVTSGLLTTGSFHRMMGGVLTLTNGAPTVSFWNNNLGNVPLTNAPLALEGNLNDGIAKGPETTTIKGYPASADKRNIILGEDDASLAYRASVRVTDFDNDRAEDARSSASPVVTGINLYDDDTRGPANGAYLQGGPFLFKVNNTNAESVSSGNNREYRITDEQLANAATLRFGINLYDFSGWGKPALTFRENGSVQPDAEANWTTFDQAAFDPLNTRNVLDATAWWDFDTSVAHDALNAAVDAGGWKVTYEVDATTTDLDDDRQNADGVNIDARSSTNRVGYFTLLDNDTGFASLQNRWNTGYGPNGGWRIPQIWLGLPNVPNSVDLLANREMLGYTNADVPLAFLTNRVYDSQLREVTAERPFTIQLPAFDTSGNNIGQTPQGVLFGTTPLNTENRTNSWLSIGDRVVANRENYRADLSSPLAVTRSAMLFPTSIWTWTQFAYDGTDGAFSVTNWLPTNEVFRSYPLSVGLYDADDDRNGDQTFREFSIGSLEVADDDTGRPVVPTFVQLGTGTNRVAFGALATWSLRTENDLTAVVLREGSLVAANAAAVGSDNLRFINSFPGHGFSGGMNETEKAMDFSLTAGPEVTWQTDVITFNIRITKDGPTNLTLCTVTDGVPSAPIATAEIRKEYNDDGTANISTNTIALVFPSVSCAPGERVTFRIGVSGATTGSQTAYWQDVSIHGIVSIPKGVEVTDYDIRTGAWTNRMEVVDSLLYGLDINRSGLWLFSNAIDHAYAPVPVFELLRPSDQDVDGSPEVVWSNSFIVNALTESREFPLEDGGFEADPSTWTLSGTAEVQTDAHAAGSVLKQSGAGETTARQEIAFEATANDTVQAICNQIYHRGDAGVLRYEWLNANGEVLATNNRNIDASVAWTFHNPNNYTRPAVAAAATRLRVTLLATDATGGVWWDEIHAQVNVTDDADDSDITIFALKNGNFASGTNYWTLSSGSSIESGGAVHGGTKSLCLPHANDAAVKCWNVLPPEGDTLSAVTLGGVLWSRGGSATVKTDFLNASDQVLDTVTGEVPASQAWNQVELPDFDEMSSEVTQIRLMLTSYDADVTYIDDLEVSAVAWGHEKTETLSAEDNGKTALKLLLSTGEYPSEGELLDLPISQNENVGQKYRLKASVADFDNDRVDDYLIGSVSNAFTLYDNDETAPQLGMMFGGPLGAFLNGAPVSTVNAGPARAQRISDAALVEVQAANPNARFRLDVDAYDFSGWTTRELSWSDGSTTFTAWSQNSGTRRMTGLLTNGMPNAASATNSFDYPVRSLWTDQQDAFAAGAVTNTVSVTLDDLDHDRQNDSLRTTTTLGSIVFMDSDVNAPTFYSSSWMRQVFIGTNNLDNAITTLGEQGPEADASDWEVEVLTPSATAEQRIQRIYDSQLRTTSADNPFYILADVSDRFEHFVGRSSSGLQRGTESSLLVTNAFNDAFTVTNTFAAFHAIDGEEPIFLDATARWSEHYSSTFPLTRGQLTSARQTWLWDSFSYTDVNYLLPAGEITRTLRAKVHAFDADTNRPSDQAQSLLLGPQLIVRDNDTVPPNDFGADGLTVNGTPVPATVAGRFDLPWTNNPISIVRFRPVTDGTPATDDLAASGIGGYRVLSVPAGIDLAAVNSWPSSRRATNGLAMPVAATEGVVGDSGFEDLGSIPPAQWTSSSVWSFGPDGTASILENTVAEGRYALSFNNGKTVSQSIELGGEAWAGKALTFSGSFAVRGVLSPELSDLAFTISFFDASGQPIGSTWSLADAGSTSETVWQRRDFSDVVVPSGAARADIRFTVLLGKNISIDDVRLALHGLEATDTVPMTFRATVQGAVTNFLFAVDRDQNRAGDALANLARPFYTAYDITPPTHVGTNIVSSLQASTDTVDDPTSQFDLSWGSSNVGPDDPESIHHPQQDVPVASRSRDLLAPWASYKVYYHPFDPLLYPEDPGPGYADSALYQEFIDSSAYTAWPCVLSTNIPADPGSSPTNYLAMTNASLSSVRLYDLDFDQDYMVIITGVDRAGNESTPGVYSWTTNNTIRFAVTQGVMRARSEIIDAFGTNHNMRASDRAAAAIFWKAAGPVDEVSGGIRVSKDYDLIYRDALSFTESPDATWSRISTIHTNWFSDASGFTIPPQTKLRFYRASYKDRWQTNSPLGRPQRPLASEEVYALNNVILSEGFNFVGLHGEPYTNTFAAVFGTDTNIWPAANSVVDGATTVAFYAPSSNSIVQELYFFAANGHWYNLFTSTDVTHTLQPPDFFTRGFSITLPSPLPEAYITTNAYYSGYQSNINAMVWHPILKVPTNGPGGAASFSQVIHAGYGERPNRVAIYNLVALNLPVSAHPSQMNLLESGFVKGSLNDGDLLYRIDTANKRLAGGSTIFCDSTGTWRYSSETNRLVENDYFHPNDIVIIKSQCPPTNGTDFGSNYWTWTYSPSNFYTFPTRNMGH